MKNSGIEWIGQIPDDWKILTISELYNLRNEKVSDNDFAPLSVTMNGILPQLETAAKSDAHDDRKLVRKGDFAINSRSDRRGSSGISDLDGSVSLINTVLQPKNNMVSIYYNWLFHTVSFEDEYYRWGHGIVDDLWTTRWQEMKQISVPFPNISLQEKIAKFLDDKSAKIDKLIETENQQIEKLKEYKQSLITEVVTKGLDKNVTLKDSGIEWIGNIPEHWEVKKLKFLAEYLTKGNGITKEDVIKNGDIQCVRYGEIYSKYNGVFFQTYSRTNLDKIAVPVSVNSGNILFAGTGELVEEIGKNILYLGNEPCLAGGDIIILSHKQNAKFLNYVLNSDYSQKQKSMGKAKLKVVHISSFDIGNILIAIPPIQEQKKITDYLDKKCADIDKIIEIKNQKIEKLNKYKKSLIYEYVTGKKEVC